MFEGEINRKQEIYVVSYYWKHDSSFKSKNLNKDLCAGCVRPMVKHYLQLQILGNPLGILGNIDRSLETKLFCLT